MLNFLKLEEFIKDKDPITSAQFLTKSEEFHPEGLFSEEIFGYEGSNERRSNFSYINLNCLVVHPSAFLLLKQLDRRIIDFLSTEKYFSLNSENKLIEDEENGVTGIQNFIKLFPEIAFRGETDTREKYIKKLKQAYNNGTLFVNYLPVIPPEFRPAYKDEDGQWIIDSLNDIYLKIIRKAFQVEGAGEGELFDLLNYDMQKTVNEHDEYIRSKLGKKQGAIRKLSLGKRADFTARAVIAPGPDLENNEAGLPLRMVVKLFEPFILHIVLRTNKIDNEKLDQEVKKHLGEDLSMDSLKRILNSIKNNDKVPGSIFNLILEASEYAVQNRVVILKRDPVLHQESLKAFYVKIINGNVIRVPTTMVSGFNADFDGDQMAVYHPMTNESQEECRQKMMGTGTSTSSDSVSFEISKEMALGLYILTKEYNNDNSAFELLDEKIDSITDPSLNVIYKKKETTAGKAIFNSCLPNDYEFIDKLINKKAANNILVDIVEKYDSKTANKVVSKLKDYGFKFATISGSTITIDNIQIPPEIMNMKQKLDGATSEEAASLLDQMLVMLKEHLKNTGLYDLVDSGSSKGWGQPMQILIAKGVIADTEGNLLEPIKASFSEGFTPTEYFKSSLGGRKGIIDRVHNTADSGYMARKLAYLLAHVEVHPTLKDCKTKNTLPIYLTNDIIKRLQGRYIVDENGKIKKFNKNDFEEGDTINLRSPVFCKSYKMCHTCYGDLVKKFKSPFVGIVAAQTLGERSTQMVMQTFHTGGTAKITKRDILNDIIENDPKAGLKKGEE